MKEAKDQRREPGKRNKAKSQVRAKKGKNGKAGGAKSRSKAKLEEAVEAPLEGKGETFQAKTQGELPLQERHAGDREPSSSKLRSRRSDRPDPDAAQHEGEQRAKADKALQEEQQRSLLGGAAREEYDHDLGDFDAEM